MDKTQITDLVILAAGNDFREVSQTNVEAWHKQFADKPWLTYELAEAALVRFFDIESKRIMAADILRLARDIIAERTTAHPIPFGVYELAEEVTTARRGNGETFQGITAAARTAIIAGEDPLAAAELYVAGLPAAIDRPER